MNHNDFVLLSELPMDTQLFIEDSEGYTPSIITKEDFLLEIENSWRDYISEIHTIYVAEPNPLQVTVRTLLGDILEYYEDDQYDDWAQDMYDDLEDSPIVASFVEELNKAAAGRVTYYPGSLVDVDIKLYDENGQRLKTVSEDQ